MFTQYCVYQISFLRSMHKQQVNSHVTYTPNPNYLNLIKKNLILICVLQTTYLPQVRFLFKKLDCMCIFQATNKQLN